MNPVEIVLTYDFSCPWCYIGLAHLKEALDRTPHVAAVIRYRPYETRPTLPRRGTPRAGTQLASPSDAEAVVAGRRAGLALHLDRIGRLPNTRLAHRLMYFAQGQRDAQKTGLLFEAIFHAFFTEGLDIGDPQVLTRLAARAGLVSTEVSAFLETSAAEREVVIAELRAQATGIRVVPTFEIGQTTIVGAQPPKVLAESINFAAGIALNAAMSGDHQGGVQR